MIFVILENHTWVQQTTLIVSQVVSTRFDIGLGSMLVTDFPVIRVCRFLITDLQEIFSFKHVVDVGDIDILRALSHFVSCDIVHIIFEI